MQDLVERMAQLKSALNIESQLDRVHELEIIMNDSNVWNNPDVAAEQARELGDLNKMIDQYQNVADMVAAGTQADRDEIEHELSSLELMTYLSGPHDSASAILSIHAGTGGVDAMDWAKMLLKMYLKYTEKMGYSPTTYDISHGEEAGIKSATIKITGLNAYGLLKGEAGVHRLVRLSPFNAKNLRQTSFALVEVIPEIIKTNLEIPEKDLRIDVYRAGGHGGQGVNTTDSAVRVTHIPTNTVVTCQNERSQLQNKATAMHILQSRLILMMEKENADELSKLKPGVQGSWGNQIRSYVLQPYTMVKDHRTEVETANVVAVLNGELDAFIQAELKG